MSNNKFEFITLFNTDSMVLSKHYIDPKPIEERISLFTSPTPWLFSIPLDKSLILDTNTLMDDVVNGWISYSVNKQINRTLHVSTWQPYEDYLRCSMFVHKNDFVDVNLNVQFKIFTN